MNIPSEYINYILGIVAILIGLYLLSRYLQKKKIKKLRQKLVEDWGRQKTNEYFNYSTISKFYETVKEDENPFQFVDDQTFFDLELDNVFKFLDRTNSKIGQQFLYYSIRCIKDKNHIKNLQQLTAFFRTQQDKRLYAQLSLKNLDTQGAYDLVEVLNIDTLSQPKYLKFHKFLSLFTFGLIIIALFFPPIFLLLIPIFIYHTFIHYKNKQVIQYMVNGVHQMNIALKVSENLKDIDGISAFFNDFQFIKTLKNIQFKTKFIGFEKQLNNEFAFILWFIVELFKILFNFEYLIFYSFINSLSIAKNSIKQLFDFLGTVDVAISTASILDTNKTCQPDFISQKQYNVENIYHPLIDNCIANSINLDQNSLLLTGSNMSGKTTFIRTLAINSLISETLGFAFATSYQAPFMKIFSVIKITDNLNENRSYFLEEILAIKQMVKASKNDNFNLFILDELLKGTNTIERISGGKAILSYLNNAKSFVLVSTHDIELTDLLKKGFDLYHFSELVNEEKLTFEYKLEEGKLKTRNALKILKLYGYPNTINEDAQQTLKQLTETK